MSARPIRILAMLTLASLWTGWAMAQQTPTSPGQRRNPAPNRIQNQQRPGPGRTPDLGRAGPRGQRRPGSTPPTLGQRRAGGRSGGRGGGASARPSAGATIVSGGGAGTVTTTTGTGGGGRGVRILGAGLFEPAKSHEVVYGDVPEIGEDVTLTFVGESITIIDFLNDLSMATGWNILASDRVLALTLRGWINELTPKQALEMLRFHGIYYEFKTDTKFFYVLTKDEYLEREYGVIVEREFHVKYANVEDIEPLVESLMSPAGRMIVMPTTSQIFVYDTEDNIKAIAIAIDRLDVFMETRSFALHHVDVEALIDTASTILSEVGELRVDPRTNTMTVIDLPIRQERIAEMIATYDRPLETRTWILNYADPQAVAEQITVFVPEEMGMIAVNESIHQIIVSAIPERLDEIDRLITAWDIKRKQVQIEAFLVSASHAVARNFGINWALFGESGNDPFAFQIGNASPRFDLLPSSGQQLSIGQLPSVTPQLNPISGLPLTDLLGNPLLRGFHGSELSAVLDYLETEGDVTILAHPRVTVLDGETAIFDNSTQVPFSRSTTTSLDRDNPISRAEVSFIDVGTILQVLPRIAAEGNILLDISSEDSSFEIVNFEANGLNNQVPQKTQNRAQTLVLVNDRDTIVIGGLRSSNVTDNVDKVPFLGDLPLIGRLFRTTRRDHKHRELLIFITPTIVDEYTHPEAIRLAQVDYDFAATMRSDRASPLGRAFGGGNAKKNEIMVTIGQSGDLYERGYPATLESLRTLFDGSGTKKVVLRAHPGAPQHVIEDVKGAAAEAGLKVIIDDDVTPLVPSFRRSK